MMRNRRVLLSIDSLGRIVARKSIREEVSSSKKNDFRSSQGEEILRKLL
jgi:hypothetical protein